MGDEGRRGRIGFVSRRRRHTRYDWDGRSDVGSADLLSEFGLMTGGGQMILFWGGRGVLAFDSSARGSNLRTVEGGLHYTKRRVGVPLFRVKGDGLAVDLESINNNTARRAL